MSKKTPQYPQKLIACDGNKGGVGKSLTATTIASILLSRGESVTLIEADKTNPDIARRFSEYAPVLLADVDSRDGWITLLEALESINTTYIVMSMPAGSNDIDNISSLLSRTLEALHIELHQVFCLSRQTDSMQLIKKSMETGLARFSQQTLALKNGFFGKNDEFDRWNTSELRKQWLKNGFEEQYLPELNHRLVDYLESNPQPLHTLLQTDLSMALRLDLQDWLQNAEQCFASVFFSSQPVEDEHATT